MYDDMTSDTIELAADNPVITSARDFVAVNVTLSRKLIVLADVAAIVLALNVFPAAMITLLPAAVNFESETAVNVLPEAIIVISNSTSSSWITCSIIAC